VRLCKAAARSREGQGADAAPPPIVFLKHNVYDEQEEEVTDLAKQYNVRVSAGVCGPHVRLPSGCMARTARMGGCSAAYVLHATLSLASAPHSTRHPRPAAATERAALRLPQGRPGG
jgi:hypothetical protein